MKTKLAFLAALLLLPLGAGAQERLKIAISKDEAAAFPGFRIAGNLYYVGTYELGCYLIDTGAGLILVNTGGLGSYDVIKANILALGFKPSDIKIITATHSHWDHVSDISAVKQDAPDAKVYIGARDVAAVESGNNPVALGAYAMPYLPRDAREKKPGIPSTFTLFDPVKVDVKVNPGSHIKLGNTDMTVLQAYGHTPGAISFNFTVRDGAKKYNVYLINTDTLNPGMKLLSPALYPGVAEDMKSTLALQATYKPDIWLSSHAFQFNMHDLYKPGDPYNPLRFGNRALYKAKIAEETAAFQRELALEQQQQKLEEAGK